MGAEFLGEANIPISSILDGRVFQDWLLLCDTTGQPVGRKDKLRGVFEQAAVRLTIKYTPVGDEVRQRTCRSPDIVLIVRLWIGEC